MKKLKQRKRTESGDSRDVYCQLIKCGWWLCLSVASSSRKLLPRIAQRHRRLLSIARLPTMPFLFDGIARKTEHIQVKICLK